MSYIVYKNDLKHRKNRNIDKNKIEWHNDEVAQLFTEDLDTVEYRITECKHEGNTLLDLNGLDLSHFPILPTNLLSSVKYLFVTGNHIRSLSIDFIHLEVLDVSYNKLESLPILPPTLIELCCRGNDLVSIDTISSCSNSTMKSTFPGCRVTLFRASL